MLKRCLEKNGLGGYNTLLAECGFLYFTGGFGQLGKIPGIE